MKNLLYILIVLGFSINICIGQKTNRIIIKPTKPNNIKESLTVLKSNPHIKKGAYLKYRNKVLIEQGYYDYNQKDSLWKYFSKSGKIMAVGYYKNDHKTGVWEYYSINGDLIQTYDHTTDSLIYYNIEKEKILYPYLAPQNNDNNARMCYFIGGLGNLYSTLENETLHPAAEFEKGETASIKVSFTIDTLGYTSEAKVQSGTNNAFEKEAIRVVQSLGKSWTPAMIEKKKVKMSYMLPINFNIQ